MTTPGGDVGAAGSQDLSHRDGQGIGRTRPRQMVLWLASCPGEGDRLGAWAVDPNRGAEFSVHTLETP
jgi:hypothetical protein